MSDKLYQLELDKPIMSLLEKDREFKDPFKFSDFVKSPAELGAVRTTGQLYNKLLRENTNWTNGLRIGSIS
jgi:hypothetical protein